MRLRPKNTLNGLLLSAIAVLTLIATLRLSLNVAGFCFNQVRFLPDREIIDLVIDNVYTHYPPAYYEISTPVRTPVEYHTREEFVSANPHCCEIVSSAFVDSSDDDFRVPFQYSLSGSNAALVRVIYRVESDPKASSSKAMPSGMIRDYRRVTNCGIVTNIL